MTAKMTLVLGGTGKTGRRVTERLRSRQVAVRVGSRTGEPPFDWENRATWPGALRHVDSAYIAYHPDLAAPGATDAIRAFTDLAVGSGVKRLVLLSGRGEPEAQACEQIVRESGVEWTLLRASWFAQNFSEGYFLDSLLTGDVALPAGNVGEPFVDADDIADVAVAALTQDGHVGQLYELTGPRLLSFADAIAEIAAAARRPIRFAQISVDEFAAGMQQAQVPAPFVDLVKYLFTEVLDGRNAWVADGVARALHRAPRDFYDYARDTAATGVWDVPVPW